MVVANEPWRRSRAAILAACALLALANNPPRVTKHATIRPSLLLNNTTTILPTFKPQKVAEHCLSSLPTSILEKSPARLKFTSCGAQTSIPNPFLDAGLLSPFCF